MSMSFAREQNENKGNTWAAAVGLGISAYSAIKKNKSEDKARQDAKDVEKKRIKQQKKLEAQRINAEMMTQAAQQSKGLQLPNVNNQNLIYWSLGAAAILIVVLLGRK